MVKLLTVYSKSCQWEWHPSHLINLICTISDNLLGVGVMVKDDNKQTVPRMSNPIMFNNRIDLSTCAMYTSNNELAI